jgi:hypothetical protein
MAFVNIANLSGADPTDPEGLAPSKSRNGQVEAAYASGIHEPTLSEYRYWCAALQLVRRTMISWMCNRARLKREEERRGEDMNGVDAHGRLACMPLAPKASFVLNKVSEQRVRATLLPSSAAAASRPRSSTRTVARTRTSRARSSRPSTFPCPMSHASGALLNLRACVPRRQIVCSIAVRCALREPHFIRCRLGLTYFDC